jgi:hypothetical protein
MYRHYKGGIYFVHGIGETVPRYRPYKNERLSAFVTNDGISILPENAGSITYDGHPGVLIGSGILTDDLYPAKDASGPESSPVYSAVVYRHVGGLLYFRPPSVFTGFIDENGYHQRFELLEDSFRLPSDWRKFQ